MKASYAYKKKGVPIMEIFQYLFLLIFSNRSMYMNLITERNTLAFAKDMVYRFMKMIQINWIRFTTILSDNIELSDEKINKLESAFMNTLSVMLKIRLQAT